MKAFFEGLFWGFITIGAIFLILFVIASSINDSMNRSEKVECRKWQEDAAKYQGFYIVQWQADQCKAHDIIINAPVK